MNSQTVKRICDASGVRVAEIRQRDDVLIVVPACLEELPGADALAGLAEQLREATSFRYVTLAVDETTPAQDV